MDVRVLGWTKELLKPSLQRVTRNRREFDVISFLVARCSRCSRLCLDWSLSLSVPSTHLAV